MSLATVPQTAELCHTHKHKLSVLAAPLVVLQVVAQAKDAAVDKASQAAQAAAAKAGARARVRWRPGAVA